MLGAIFGDMVGSVYEFAVTPDGGVIAAIRAGEYKLG